MKLTVSSRETGKKSALKRMRFDGAVPGVLYNCKGETQNISIDKDEFEEHLRSMKKGFLATTVFELEMGGKKIKALVKEVQYHRVTYRIIHIDFLELKSDGKVRVNVPIECVGMDKCPGIKQGGQLKKVRRSVSISCLGKDLPKEFVMDVSELGLGQSKRVQDVELTGSMCVKGAPRDVLVVVGK